MVSINIFNNFSKSLAVCFGMLLFVFVFRVPAYAEAMRTPSSPGTVLYSGGGVSVDASNASEGYITVKYSGSSPKVKLQITKSGGKAYTYNLSSSGSTEVFPLTSGDGTYQVGAFENIRGTEYSTAYTTSFSVVLRNAALPFLYPSQYVNYTQNSAVVSKAATIAAGAQNDLEVVSRVYNYVIANLTYDEQKAQNVKSGYLPNVDAILSSGKGICFDYAAVMAAMLRSQNIPTKLEVGYVSSGVYHAWISTYVANSGWVNNVISFDGNKWKMMDPTFASSGSQSDVIMKYIGNGTNYSTQFVY